MRYANILSNAIAESGMTYSQISMKCELKGKKLSRAYLSLLCTGHKPPATDETNKVLASVLASLDFRELTVAKYREVLSPETFNIICTQGAKICEESKTS
ncbi:hypothetical protein QVE09_16120 [Paenibacillus sp. ClWae2A]|uniref:hypothetical protein n=1 Tax=Paenibacillus sp. ClWae2A TaxID=3057177 RepID=UPI0028F4E09B|nr:hypothetical protein [Paenibacillus sp. ClWae2A]MDT9720446.1 hypothetical protein [Paenibacillus sp. ClWae2A]